MNTNATGAIRAEAPRADGAAREILLARGNVLIRRRLHGVAMRVNVPTQAYRGVVLSLDATEAGGALYRISLWHSDPDLRVCLHEAYDDRDIVADWKSWAKYFALPKFIEREPGRLEGSEQRLGEVALGRCMRLRRRGALMTKRRPSILRRRKNGDSGRMENIHAGERVIICYE